jgi:hypothetical protein
MVKNTCIIILLLQVGLKTKCLARLRQAFFATYSQNYAQTVKSFSD